MAQRHRILRLLDRLWQLVSTPFRRDAVEGAQRSATVTLQSSSRLARNFDLEIPEIPVRNGQTAVELIEMCSHCPEIATANEFIKDDVLGSADGDDIGFIIEKALPGGQQIEPQVFEILQAAKNRLFGISELEMIVDRVVQWGDCFGERVFDNPRNPKRIDGLMFLPTWEMFRCEEQGILKGFEQRRYLSEQAPDHTFHPIKITHWRRRRAHLYGRSQYLESLEDWGRLKEATENFAMACNDVGINPTVHVMPEGTDKAYRDAYKTETETRLEQGIVTHFYMMPGGDVRKLANNDPKLEALAEAVLLWRSRIVMRSQVPFYLFPGLKLTGAREIEGQPAMAHARSINRTRACISRGIRETLNVELALNGIDPAQWPYQIKWPKLMVNVFQGQDVNLAEGADETDTEPNSRLRRTERMYVESV